MFYSVLLTIAADARLVELGLRQLAWQMPVEGHALVRCSKIFSTSKIIEKTYVHVDISWQKRDKYAT
jgi:hypothetical protein